MLTIFQADNWKRSKFKALVENYVLPGSQFEINISYYTRNRIIKQYNELQTLPASSLSKVFDEAYEDVNSMLTTGAWREFFLSQTKFRPKSKIEGTKIVSSGL